jgi:hypothetical protein
MSEWSENEGEGDDSSGDEQPGSMPFFKDMPPRHVKGSRRTIFAFIVVVILVPVVVGGLFYLLRSLQSPGY